MKRVLFLRNVSANWTQTDLDILKKKFKVTDLSVSSGFSILTSLLKVFTTDVVFAWFGSLSYLPAAVLAKLLGKKVYIVTAGYDVAKVPVGEYGAFCEGVFSRFLRYLLYSSAYRILSCSKSNFFEGIFFAEISAKKLKLIELGFERPAGAPPLKPWSARKNQVAIVSSMGADGFYRKGVFRSLQLAERMPDVDFVMIGGVDSDLKHFIEENFSKNIKLTGYVDFYSAEYATLLNESKVFLQLSFHEGFGASVLDAAVFGCAPVVSGEYSLPEVVGKLGYVVGLDSYDAIAKTIYEVLDSSRDVNVSVEYYLNRYPIAKRAEKINTLILQGAN